jgi:hypothetical protein
VTGGTGTFEQTASKHDVDTLTRCRTRSVTVVKEIAVVLAPEGSHPGHLGKLTRLVPFEMVDAALAATGTLQPRVRRLPSRAVVYLLLAGGLFAELGWRQV